MVKRYFWRRGLAYFVDLTILALLFACILIVLNSMVKTRFVAPGLISSLHCQSGNYVSAERMNELLPIENGQQHVQLLCHKTAMVITSYNFVKISRITKKDGINYSQYISYAVDDNGKRISVYSIEPVFYMFAPLIFSFLVARRGRTPGKSMLKLKIENENKAKLTIKKALVREYLKGAPFILFTISGFHADYQANNIDLETAHLQLGPLAEMTLSVGFFSVWLLLPLSVFIVIFWYIFGSFIRWRGKTYWDRVAGSTVRMITYTSKPNDVGGAQNQRNELKNLDKLKNAR